MFIKSYHEIFNPFFSVQILDKKARTLLNKTKGSIPFDISSTQLVSISPQDILSFEYDETKDKASMVKLHLLDDNLEKLNSPNYKQDNILQCVFGYLGGMISRPMGFHIAGINPDFSVNGHPTLEIIAYDFSFTLGNKFRRKNWGKLPSSEIAMQIADLNDFDYEVDDSDDFPKQDVMQSPNISDILFLISLAKKIGFLVYMDGNTLYYIQNPTQQEPIKTFHYRNYDGAQNTANMISFKPKANTKANPGLSEGDGKTRTKATPETSKQVPSDEKYRVSDLSGEAVRVKPEASGVKHTPSPETLASIKKAQAELDEQNLKMFEGVVHVLGDPTIHSKTAVLLKGLGNVYSGKYYVEGVKHKISASGYTLELTVNRSGFGIEAAKKAAAKKEAEGKQAEKLVKVNDITGKQVE